MATGVQNAAEFGRLPFGAHLLRIAAFNVDAKLFFQNVNLLVQRQLLPTEYPWASEGGTANHDGIDAVGIEGAVGIAK